MDIRTPVRVTHMYTQSIEGTPAEVLPLLCPVLEVEWASGWEPGLVLSESGVAERDCVFTTPDLAAGPGAEAIWTVLAQDREAGSVEMLKVTPGFLVVRLTILLTPAGRGCHAEVTYTYTALGPAGEAFVRSWTPEAYAGFMREWETELNAYLDRTRAVQPV